jgi:molybdopterin-containing oxidoreductase family iron-sulfur binding subunit
MTMSAKEPEQHEHEHHEHTHSHSEDNYDAAYSPEHVEEALPPTPEHGYWRSLRELDEGITPSQNEFPAMPEVTDPLSRRNFFQLMGASMALAGVATGCRYEKEDIVPLARRPEDQVPGQAQQYATSCEIGGVGHALLVTSFEGRPIKIDGNPEHPFASGAIVTGTERHAGCSTFAQASVLNMYDPDRSQNPSQAGKGGSMDGFRAALATIRAGLAGGRVLSEASSSPTVKALKNKLMAKYPGLTWTEYEPLSWDNERAGTKLAFGKPVRALAHLDRAETIVTIDCDIFVEHPAAMQYSRDFARSRRVNGTLGIGKMNRLYAIESTFSHTGAMADHRLSVRSEHGLAIALAIDAALGGGGGTPTAEILREKKVDQYIRVLVEELQQNKGRAIVLAGRRQSPEVHALVARINNALGAVGTTVDYVEDPDVDRPRHVDAIKTLATQMASGAVKTLIMIGGNPVYDAPVDLDFTAALAKVETSVHLSDYMNETSQKASWHVPRAHFLEAWGDNRTWDGTISIQQPLIAPLYGGLSTIELLSMLLGDEKTGEEIVRATHDELGIAGNWRQSVHDGFVPNTALPVAQGLALTTFAPAQPTGSAAAGSVLADGEFEVTFHYSSNTYDGRFANNAWLQETPDFLTKVTWDNYALVSPDAKLTNDTIISVKVEGREVKLPAYTMPGHARSSIALVLGGGRTAAGRVGGEGKKTVGVNTYKVRSVAGFDFATKATAKATGEAYELASVQEHWDIRTGLKPEITQQGIAERLPQLVQEITNADLVKDKAWSAEGGPEQYWDDENVPGDGPKRHLSLFREKEYAGHRWGMAIDLSTCTGCNACMVACQAENNIPVVGRKEIFNNREMHWIRIDRYFGGSKADPVVVHQPVACQQCENAPCEQVCPVGATSHSDEGLNDMAYNRCIGTRYCANNCPYKVRKFNFLDWNKEWREARNKVRRLLFNPEVTVRMRGVMEKCTFCVQRIQNAKIHAKAQIRSGQRPGNVNEPMPDGEVETACQQACPTEAIIFGDLSDKNSRVSRLHADRRGYPLLAELYTKPRNRFLAKVRNPNPKLAPPPKPKHEPAKPAPAGSTKPTAGSGGH